MKVELYKIYYHDCGFAWVEAKKPYYHVGNSSVVYGESFNDPQLLKLLWLLGITPSRHRFFGPEGY